MNIRHQMLDKQDLGYYGMGSPLVRFFGVSVWTDLRDMRSLLVSRAPLVSSRDWAES